ncbi:MAG: permease [Methyloligellaceae bacterium]
MTIAEGGAPRSRFPSVRVDRVWLTIAGLLLTLFAVDRAQGLESLYFLLDQFVHVLPFLALAVTMAAYATATGADNLIARAFSGHIVMMIFLAALIGGLSPFCSCGVIPLIAALLAMGVPLPAVMAFWLSSPLMDPSMFVLTLGTLGTEFAVGKTMAAVGVGLFGGIAMLALSRLGAFEAPLRAGVGDGGCAGGKVRAPKVIVWRFWHDRSRRQAFARDLVKNGLFLGKWLSLAFLLESVMLAYVPGAWIAGFLGGDGLGAIVLAALVGIPAYLNGYAALPLISGLIETGMAPGAGMAFLIAGGVSSCPAAIAVFALVRAPVFFTYLGLAFAGAILSGALFGLAI